MKETIFTISMILVMVLICWFASPVNDNDIYPDNGGADLYIPEPEPEDDLVMA